MHFKKILPLLLAMFSLAIAAKAQVTTGTLSGVVKNAKGEPTPGATITAIHVPTGSKYTTVAKSGGQYTLPNLRVGGPYTITISFVGYTDDVYNDQYITLGGTSIDGSLKPSNQVLSTVVVTGRSRNNIISSQRNGTSTNISARLVQSLPTINRSVQDFARLTPQVKAGNSGVDGSSAGLSFAGQSNRYNQFSVDGANASDAFGLSSGGTNGGNSNINPISIESIQEMQIVLSPYDVTQGGFTGGGINAVTKSGTNKLHGAVYGNYQNEGFVGKSVRYNSSLKTGPTGNSLPRIAYGDFKNQTYGASLGGAIVKNKLFFFVSGERYEKQTPLAFDPTQVGSGSRASKDTLQKIKDYMLNTFGYNLGSYGAITNTNESTSFFGRIDWNISTKHKLTLRHSYVDGSNDVRSRTATSVIFENTGYRIKDRTNSSVLELNSSFSSRASNVLRLTYNNIRDQRIVGQVPNISITNSDVDPTAAIPGTRTSITYTVGSDFSSAANSLNQDIFSVTDNFTLYKGKHTLTFGTNNEFFKSSNVFIQGYYGAYTYSLGTNTTTNIPNFLNNTGLTTYQVGYGTAGRGNNAAANLKAAQYSVYGQDVWATSSNFKLTYGLRVDLPVISNNPSENTAFNTSFAAYDAKTNQMPKRRLMFSPRVGFNWNVEGTGELQIRGGLGIFTGRVPFVWVSNQFSNTGVEFKNLTYNSSSNPTLASTGIKLVINPNDPQLGAFIPTTNNPQTVINVIDKNFKFPQVFRANLAADKKIGTGFVLTVEGIFTKNINNATYTNLNISDNGETTVAIGPTTRPFWTTTRNTAYSQVLKLTNTSKGYSMNFTAQLQKTYSKGWQASLAYNYGISSSLTDLPSSVALSNWTGVATVNGLNKLDLSPSNFETGSRITGFVSKEFKYAKHLATTFTLFYNGQSGQRLSYLYSTTTGPTGTAGTGRNITGESTSAVSLVYLPANATEANFADISGGATASQQWANYQAFAAANPYLSKHAGQNAQRNGDKLPFESHFDLRVAQDFVLKGHKLQVFFDVLNLGALISEDFGRSYGTGSNPDGFFPISTTLFTPVLGAQKKDGVAFTPTPTTPAFQFNINNFTKIGDNYRPYNINNFTSRWSSQIGARYSF